MAGKLWTSKELEILKEKLLELGLDRLLAAGLLDRTRAAISTKSLELGIKAQCPDCGKQICWESVRCNSCATKAAWARGDFEREQWRRKRSEAQTAAHARGDFDSEEYRRKQSEATKAAHARGAFAGEETRRKRSESMKARWARGDYDGVFDSEETRRKMLEGQKAARARGAYDSTETRRKLSEASKAAWASGAHDSEETRRKKSEGMKAAWASGAHDSEETRRKMSESSKAAWARGAYDGAFDSEETRRKLSESMKAARARGAYDGVYQSPTKPERAIMAVLDFMGIDFTFNTLRLESYTYDFHLPDLQVLVEYDGWYWHGKPKAIERDRIKDDLAEQNGFRLIRLKGGRGKDLAGSEIWGRLSQEL